MLLRSLFALLLSIICLTPAYASQISLPFTFSPLTAIQSSQVNQNYSTIYNDYNGNITNFNVATNAQINPMKFDATKAYPLLLQAAGTDSFLTGNTGDTVARWKVNSDGKLFWGPGGNTAVDTCLKRDSAGVLRVRNGTDSADGNFTCNVLTLGTPLTAANGGTGAATASTGQVLAGPANTGSGANYSAPAAAAYSNRALVPQDVPLAPQNVRLYCIAGAPTDAADHLAVTTLEVGPSGLGGNLITLKNTTQSVWQTQTFSEISFSVPATTAQMYDVFAQSATNTTISVSTLAWTNDTTRATALALDNGSWVLSSDHSKLYIGSFRTGSVSGQTIDSAATRYVVSFYNRLPVSLYATDSTASWSYGTATWRTADNKGRLDGTSSTSFISLGDSVIRSRYTAMGTTSAAGAGPWGGLVGIALDSTTANPNAAALVAYGGFNGATTWWGGNSATAEYVGVPAAGAHYLCDMEYQFSGGTTSWFGVQGSAPTAYQIGEFAR